MVARWAKKRLCRQMHAGGLQAMKLLLTACSMVLCLYLKVLPPGSSQLWGGVGGLDVSRLCFASQPGLPSETGLVMGTELQQVG